MNIIQKHKSKVSKVYLNEEDNNALVSKLAENLLEFLSLTPIDYSIQINIMNVNDISMDFFSLLLSFIKTANDKNLNITIFLQPKLADLILNFGTGNLQYSLELTEEIK